MYQKVVLIILLVPFWALSKTTYFFHQENKLQGQYLEPINKNRAKAIVIFVHGDGALNSTAEGYYELIWQPLRQNGYAVFSWSKPGVGRSSGNWLQQTMFDRQQEVAAAIEYVQKNYGYNRQHTVLLGFSQAGWVIPKLATDKSNIGYLIGVGFAKNWIEQGLYYTKTSASISGVSREECQKVIKDYHSEIALLETNPSYETYLNEVRGQKMSKDRFEFVLKNFKSDATESYKRLSKPSLLMWGKQDLNVDANQEYLWWQNENNPMVTAVLIDDATHSMLNAHSFNSQTFGIKQWLKLMWHEQDAFSPEFMPTLINWLDKHLK